MSRIQELYTGLQEPGQEEETGAVCMSRDRSCIQELRQEQGTRAETITVIRSWDSWSKDP